MNDHSKDTERNHIKRNSKVCGLSSHNVIFNKKYKKIVPKIFKILHQAKEEFGTPGISFSISYNGDLVLKGGIGLADVENHVPCTSETVLRIASISKSLTTLAIGMLISYCECASSLSGIGVGILFKTPLFLIQSIYSMFNTFEESQL